MSARLPVKPGDRFGRLTLLEETPMRASSTRDWRVVCDCGTVLEVRENGMKSGHSSSCGCLNREMTSKATRQHGLGATSESQAWRDMRKRCFNPKDPNYPNYGGRGIDIDPRWDDFMTFLADVGPKPHTDYTLDRRDNSRGHWPDNVRWVPMAVQQRNKRTNCVLEVAGVRRVLVDWARLYSIDDATLYHRYKRVAALGLPIETILTPKGEFRRIISSAQPAVAL